MIIRKKFQPKCKPKKEMPGQAMSTPDGSESDAVTPDISVIEPTSSLPTLISTESMEIVEPNMFCKVQEMRLHPASGIEIVQQTGHCRLPSYLTPNAIRRRLGLGKKNENTNPNLTGMPRLAKQPQKPDHSSQPPDEATISRPTAATEDTQQSAQPTEPNVVAGKLAKSSSPFKRNFALQTIQKCTIQTSPLQSVANAGKTSIGLQDECAAACEEPRAARSCPGSPRGSAHWGSARSRSQSPPPRSQDTTPAQKRLTTTLKDIVGRITSTFGNAECKSPDDSGTECTQSRMASKPIPRGVRFVQRGGIDKATRDVEELYFNKEMDEVQSLHGPYSKQGFGSNAGPPWVQVARPYSRKDGFHPANLACKCENPTSSTLAPCRCVTKSSTTSQPASLGRFPPQFPRAASVVRPQTAPSSPLRSSLRPPRPSSPATCCQQPPPAHPARGLPPQGPPRICVTFPQRPQPPSYQSPPLPPRSSHTFQPPPQNYQPGIQKDSGVSGSDSVCNLQNKLIATQICLKNKEETVRVQSESLKCAEKRIAMLTLRAAQQRCELQDLHRELKQREEANTSGCDDPSEPCCNTDACCQCEAPDTEVERQKMVVKTLQGNLSVIEDLYRECFYETAKQEELIEKLRKSYLDVRLMEKEKADRIGRLENVVNTQKWSVETCQGIAVEVENLKMEIMNFLNSSNNDSGVWEQSVGVGSGGAGGAGGVGEDISDILLLLHQLREVLQDEEGLDCCTTQESKCTSALQNEIKNLRELNSGLENKIKAMGEDRRRLDDVIREKEDTIIALRKEKDDLTVETRGLRCDLEAANKRAMDLENENECVRKQLKDAQAEVGHTKSEIGSVRGENDELRQKNITLAEEIERADMIIKENLKIRSSVSYLTQQVALWRQQLEESEERVRCVEAELARARSHVRNVDLCYKEKAEAVCALEAQLQEAHARGARLCAESRRVVCAVRGWIRRMQATNKEQSQTIKEQQACILELQRRAAPAHPARPAPPEHCSPCPERARCRYEGYYATCQPHPQHQPTDGPAYGVECGVCAGQRASPTRSPPSSDDVIVSCDRCAPARALPRPFRSEIAADYQVGCSKCAPDLNKQRLDDDTESGSGSLSHVAVSCVCERDGNTVQASGRAPDDVASCSHIPVPPRRLLRKKLYNDRVAHFLRCTAAGGACEAGVQQPARRDSDTSPPAHPAHPAHLAHSRIPRAVSPSSELLERVSHLGRAMEASQRRWARAATPHPQRDQR